MPREAVDATTLKLFKAGWGFEQPGLVEGVIDHGREVGTRTSLKSLLLNTFCDSVKFCKSEVSHFNYFHSTAYFIIKSISTIAP